MDIMCLMGLFPKGYEDEIVRNSIFGTQNAANKLQWGIVKGLDAQPGVTVRVCNSLYIGAYPKRYRKAVIPTFSFEHCPGANDVNIGFLNLPVIKQLSRYIGVRRQLDNWARKITEDKKVLLVYALTTPFVQLASYIQKKYPNVKVCIVVPDLPEYMNVGGMQKNGLYAKVKRLEIAWLKHCSRCVSNYVLLTDAMKQWFDHDIRYAVVEGITPEASHTDVKQVKEKSVIYAGGIKKEYGVLSLIEAFMQVDRSEWKLFIYGNGIDLDIAKKMAANDSRIVFMGMQPNSIVVEHQKRASLLVNPRKNEEFAKYSFPSKVLEYMASGTAMLAYKLDGVPNEYDEFYYHIPNGDSGMKDMLQYVIELPEEMRSTMGTQARVFVETRKNPYHQCGKIINLINDCV